MTAPFFKKIHNLIAVLAVSFCSSLAAGVLQPISIVNSNLTSTMVAGNDALDQIISADGRYVVFASAAYNLLVTNGTNFLYSAPSKMNVYFRDRTNQTTILVSVTQDIAGFGVCDSFPMAISTNGQYVLFESEVRNVGPGSNFWNGIFVRDVINNVTTLVNTNHDTSGRGQSGNSTMTPDGRFVAFEDVTNLAPEIFVRDLQTQITNLVSVRVPALGTNNSGAYLPDITPDGRYVAFYSTSTNLVAGGSPNGEIYVRDITGANTILASAYSHGIAGTIIGTTNTLSFNHTISDDGQFVTYETVPFNGSGNGIILRQNLQSFQTDIIATNAVGVLLGSERTTHSLDMTPDGRFVAYVIKTNSNTAVYVWDAVGAHSTLASGDLGNQVPGFSTCDSPVLDSTGRYVAFSSTGIGLVSDSTVMGNHLYVRDLQTSTTYLADAATNGNGSIPLTTIPRMSADGKVIAFESLGKNGVMNIFATDVASRTVELISVAQNPNLTPNGLSTLGISSANTNAHYIAFSSEANNLVLDDTNGLRDIFVHDVLNGTNILVSIAANNLTPGNGFSTDPAISADGRYVAFTSMASNLITGHTNFAHDVFVRDLQSNHTVLASLSLVNNGPGNGPSSSPIISANGRYVLFHSHASDLLSGISSTNFDNIYLRDLQTGVTRAFITNTTAVSAVAAMTPDAHFVAESLGDGGVYVWDTQANTNGHVGVISGTARAIGISPDGNRLGVISTVTSSLTYAIDRTSNTTATLQGAPGFRATAPRFSGDNRYMVYVSAYGQIVLYDFQTKSNLWVSYRLNSVTNGSCYSPDISFDGRYVAYCSVASNIVSGVTNNLPNVYLYDRVSGSNTLVTVSAFENFAAAGRSLNPVFSGDGQTLLLESWAPDLSAQDFNQWSDLFALSLYSTTQPPAFSIIIIPPTTNNNTAPTLTWAATPGVSYSVQYKTNLADSIWQTLADGQLTTNGNQLSITDGPFNGQKFYRVVAVQSQ